MGTIFPTEIQYFNIDFEVDLNKYLYCYVKWAKLGQITLVYKLHQSAEKRFHKNAYRAQKFEKQVTNIGKH